MSRGAASEAAGSRRRVADESGWRDVEGGLRVLIVECRNSGAGLRVPDFGCQIESGAKMWTTLRPNDGGRWRPITVVDEDRAAELEAYGESSGPAPPPADAATSDRFLAGVAERAGWIQERLSEHGGLLFRGFLGGDPVELERFLEAAGLGAMEYQRGNAPRNRVRGQVYTSTEVSRHLPIPIHCEMAYVTSPPRQIAFLCQRAAIRRGETPLADMHAVYRSIRPDVRQRFENRGVTYVQSVPLSPGPFRRRTRSSMFGDADLERIVATCERMGTEVRELPSGTLELRSTLPAVIEHPESGLPIWFNHAHVFHPTFASELRRSGLRLVGGLLGMVEGVRGSLPGALLRHRSEYGDGQPIPRADIEVVRDALWGQATMAPWQVGDLLLLDNQRIGHARMPFRGPRRILTALIDRVDAFTPAAAMA